ncbi:MAG: GNAT family N-acetyltransferase [Prosthecobacter sp.]|uniref:GNAT family N-acetyltransferase n=1 Tax=Prosthecobacter sp. TaxID=1965333 RepID=UPI002606767F|nr:GNAT family N-acetyltransferase [Prosthecobacter sp.]MCF7789174.1 GNAT family N-acetyltransferase [Prosthecobacter sp.]
MFLHKLRHDAADSIPALGRGVLTLDIVRDEAGFHALQPFWDTLVEQMATRSPFVRWDWMSLWWEECRKEARLVIGVLRDAEGMPQAIAPLMLASEPDSVRKHLVTLTFLAGFGEAHGERLDLIVPAGREDELTPQLCRVFKLLQPECDNVRLNHLPEESPNKPHLLAVLEEAFCHAGVLNRHAGRFIHLPASWEDYEARHSSKWRNLLRRGLRSFTAEHAGKATHAGERMSIAEAMKEFRVLHGMQWEEGVSSFTTEASWRFHQRLAARWLPQQRAWMPLLEADGKLIAALYGFVEREQFFHYQSGWERSLAKISPGKLVIRWSIECCIQRGLRVYDMLSSDYEYKRQWCDGARWLLDLEAFNPASWRGTAFRTLRALRRWLPGRTSATVTVSNEFREELEPVPPPAA